MKTLKELLEKKVTNEGEKLLINYVKSKWWILALIIFGFIFLALIF